MRGLATAAEEGKETVLRKAFGRDRKSEGATALRAGSAPPPEDAEPPTSPSQSESNGSSTPRLVPDEITIAQGGSRLGEVLHDRGLVSRSQLVEALLQQDVSGQRLGALLVELGVITEEALVDVLAEQAGVDSIDLRGAQPQRDAIERLSESIARGLSALPIQVDEDDVLHVAVADPSEDTRRSLEQAAGTPVRLFAAPQSAIRRLLDATYRALEDVGEFVQRFETADEIRHAAESVSQDSVADDAPVVQVVNLLLTQALRDRASDVHVEPQDTRIRLRYRIDGALHDILALPPSMGPALVSRLKIMAGLNIVERRRPQDGHFSLSVEGSDLDVRVAITPTIWGEKVVLRLLDKSRPLFRLGDLGMSPETEKIYSELIRAPFGMVVCSGPTGSGKTTTLYATVLEINDTEDNITTIEDPVEYILPAVNQIQINEGAGVTFVTGLRSILRQDPDVILIGEIRDTDTARIAIRSALTGHLVFSSIHATDAASAIQRLVDMDVEPFLVSSSVRAVVAQRLVRRICSYCRVEYRPPADEMAFYRESGGPPKARFTRGEGCNFCAQSGFRDRVGVYELLVLTDDIKEMIVRGASRDEIRNTAIEEHGLRTLRQEGLRLVDEDITTISEVVRSIWTM